MASVSRADRRCAREIISSLESDPNLNPEKVLNFKKYLSSLGFSEESEYFTRINSLETKLNEQEVISSLPNTIRYSGVYSNKRNLPVPVKLYFSYDHLFLSRNYKNKLKNSPGVKISWRFESNGELYLIDSLDITSRDVTHLLGPPRNGIWQNNWPRGIDFIFYGFPNLDSAEKTDLLLKWGYTSAFELYQASLGKKLKDSSFLQGNELGLTKIDSNPLVLNILKKASSLDPRFTREEGFGNVLYRYK